MQPSHWMPMKAIVRCRVKQTLLATVDPDSQAWPAAFDDALIQDLTAILYQGQAYRDRYAACTSKVGAAAIADEMVTDIANTYQSMQARRRDPIVQWLNRLTL